MQEVLDAFNDQKNEQLQLSQETIAIKDNEIQTLSIELETMSIQKQSIESQLFSLTQQMNAHKMKKYIIDRAMQQYKDANADLLLQLNEYKENAKHNKLDNDLLCKQLT